MVWTIEWNLSDGAEPHIVCFPRLTIAFIWIFFFLGCIKGISMQPALNPSIGTEDYVFLSKWAVRNMYVQRGDIISLISPKDPSQKLIKRIVGLQGEFLFRLTVRDSFQLVVFCCYPKWIVWITGDIVPTIGYKKPYVKIPPGHCWIEGDHTGHSLDSNTFGPVSLGLMTARATFVVWPPARWQILANEVPQQRKLVALGKSKSSIDWMTAAQATNTIERSCVYCLNV